MNQTDQLALSMLLDGQIKEAGGLAAPLLRGLGRTGAVAVKGLNVAGDVMHDLPGMMARGGGRFAARLAKLPGQAAEEIRTGYRAGMAPKMPSVNPFAGNVSNEALEGMGIGSKTEWAPPAMPMGATAGARAQSVMAEAGSPASERIAGAGGEGPATPGATPNFWHPKTPMQNFGSIINQMPAERLRRSMGLATGEGRSLADVGRRGAMIGGGGLYGATIAGEAPGKMQENAKYEWQQQHPLMARLGQMLNIMPEAQHRNLLNPFA